MSVTSLTASCKYIGEVWGVEFILRTENECNRQDEPIFCDIEHLIVMCFVQRTLFCIVFLRL